MSYVGSTASGPGLGYLSGEVSWVRILVGSLGVVGGLIGGCVGVPRLLVVAVSSGWGVACCSLAALRRACGWVTAEGGAECGFDGRWCP